MNRQTLLATACLLAGSAGWLPGQTPGTLVLDFEDGVNPFSDGTISTDQAVSGTNSVYFELGDFGTFSIPPEYSGQNLVITMKIYDQGLWIDRDVPGFAASSYGARWGVGNSPDDGANYLAATISERTFGSGGFLSSVIYGLHPAVGRGFGQAPWFTIYGYSGSDAVRAPFLGNGGSNDGGFWSPPEPGPGGWTEWTFTVLANGDATYRLEGLELVDAAGGPLYNIGGEATGIYLFGGSTNADGFGSLSGVYVDDITIGLAPDDIEPPSTPSGLTASGVTGSSVDLQWEASTDNDAVLGYYVYTNGANPVSVTETSTTVGGLAPGTDYTFSVSAFDATGNESSRSSGVEVTTSGTLGQVIDFEDGTNPFSAGTVTTDYAFDGSNALYLGNRETGTYTLDPIFAGKDLIITMQVLDLGLWVDGEVDGRPNNAYGPRWGVGTGTAAPNYVAATIIQKTFLPSSAGYALHAVTGGDDFGTTSWFSPSFYSGSDRVVLSEDGGSNPGTGWVPGTPAAEPVWTTWKFTVTAGGDLTLQLNDLGEVTGNNIGGPASTVLLYGGNDGSGSMNALTGLYVDRITISEVEPDTEPPTIPDGLLTSEVTESSVRLDWNPSSDNDAVEGYRVYTNGENPLDVADTTVVVEDLEAGRTYTFTVSAIDPSGNESDPSAGVEATTPWPVGLLIGFEDGENPFGAGTLSEDYAFGGTSALYLGNRETATLELPGEFQDTEVIVTLQVLDLGLWVDSEVEGRPSNAYGPRWGVGNAPTAPNYVAASIIHKGFLPSSAGYGLHQVSSGDDFGTTSWFSPSFYSGSERAVLSEDGGSNPGSGWMPGTPAAEPVWTEWTFHVTASGDLTLTLSGQDPVTGNNIGGAASTIYLYGGNDGSSSQNALTGLYVDNIALTAVPQDTTPPSQVTGLTAVDVSNTEVELAWDPADDDRGVAGYRILSTPDLGTIEVTGTTVILTELDSATEYTFTVVAFDEAGNESAASEDLVVTTDETIPPYNGPDYYVDPENGSIDGNGSEQFPWDTLQAVFEAGKAFNPGDTLYLMDGLHGEPAIDGMNADTVFIMPAEGANPRLIRLHFSDTSSNWEVSGMEISPSFAAFYERGRIVGIGGSDNALLDSIIYSVPDTSGWGLLEWTSRSSGGVSLTGPRNRLENCSIRNVYHGISATKDAPFAVVSGNSVENFGGDGMRGLGDDQVFEYNYVAECYNIDDNHDDGFQSWTEGEDGQVGTGTVYRMTLRGNMFVQTTDTARDFQGPLQAIGCFDGTYEDWIIENNVIITNHTHGITLFGAVNCRFVNNTVIDVDPNSARPTIWISDDKDGTPPSGNLVRNNLATIFNVSDDADITMDNNKVVTPAEYATYFADHPYDLSLRDGSPAIDAGTNEGAPDIDITGFQRPFDGDWDGIAITDLGAYEDIGEWVEHFELGWIYVGEIEDLDNMWIYSLFLDSWVWSSSATFPLLYDWGNNRWVYYLTLPNGDVWLFDYSNGTWMLNP